MNGKGQTRGTQGARGAQTEMRPEELEARVRALRVGHGANCSSIGSVIDTLFVGALFGGAVFAAVAAALGREPVRVVGGSGSARGSEGGGEGEAGEEDGE